MLPTGSPAPAVFPSTGGPQPEPLRQQPSAQEAAQEQQAAQEQEQESASDARHSPPSSSGLSRVRIAPPSSPSLVDNLPAPQAGERRTDPEGAPADSRLWPIPAVTTCARTEVPATGTLFQVQRFSRVFFPGVPPCLGNDNLFDAAERFFRTARRHEQTGVLHVLSYRFSIRKTRYRPAEIDIYRQLSEARARAPARPGHAQVLIPEAFLMGLLEPQPPSDPPRLFCYQITQPLTANLHQMMTKALHHRMRERATVPVVTAHGDAANMSGLLRYYADTNREERLIFSVQLIKRVLESVLHGLHFLHSNGIAHNNIHPCNILYQHQCHARHGNTVFACTCGPATQIISQVKICDLAQATDEHESSLRHFRRCLGRQEPPGTQGFQPPEWTSGQPWSPDHKEKADIWSLGCTVLQLFISQRITLEAEEARFLLDHWRTGPAASAEDQTRAARIRKLQRLQQVFPTWQGLHQFAEACLIPGPAMRPAARDLLPQDQESGPGSPDFRNARAFWSS